MPCDMAESRLLLPDLERFSGSKTEELEKSKSHNEVGSSVLMKPFAKETREFSPSCSPVNDRDTDRPNVWKREVVPVSVPPYDLTVRGAEDTSVSGSHVISLPSPCGVDGAGGVSPNDDFKEYF